MTGAAVVLPEAVLVLSALVLLGFWLAGRPLDQMRAFRGASAVMIVIAILIALDGSGAATAFGGSLVDDPLARLAKVLILAFAALFLGLGRAPLDRQGAAGHGFPAMVLLAAASAMIVASASDLLVLVLALEALALTIAPIAGSNRRDAPSAEAGGKALLGGVLASAVMIYGASLVYGFTGATQFRGIAVSLADGAAPFGLLAGFGLMVVGLAAKAGLVPFHLGHADVGEGAPIPAAALLATVPAIACLVLFARLVIDGFAPLTQLWWPIVAFIAVASTVFGAVSALAQNNLKRSIMHLATIQLGFAFAGLAAGTAAGVQALLTGLMVFSVTNAGLYAILLMLERDGQPVDAVAELKGLAHDHPAQAAGLAVLLVSLAGLPPLLGFFAKYQVMAALITADLAPLALALALAWLLGAYACLRIVVLLYLAEPDEGVDLAARFTLGAALAASAVLLAAPWLPFVGDFGVPEIALAAAEGLVE